MKVYAQLNFSFLYSVVSTQGISPNLSMVLLHSCQRLNNPSHMCPEACLLADPVKLTINTKPPHRLLKRLTKSKGQHISLGEQEVSSGMGHCSRERSPLGAEEAPSSICGHREPDNSECHACNTPKTNC